MVLRSRFKLNPRPPGAKRRDALSIFLKKTAPAYSIALVLLSAQPPGVRAADLSWKLEKHFGRQTVEGMREEYGFVRNPLLDAWLNDLGGRLAAVSDRTDIPYEFHIVDSDETNAFAAPGGFVFVTRGLLKDADNDDEIAAVLGHETAHVAAKHGWKNIRRSGLIAIGMNLLSDKDRGAARVGGVVAALAQLHYGREDEYQADELGERYAWGAGYDPAGMAGFFQKLQVHRPAGGLGRLEAALSSHPKTPNRIAAARRANPLAENNPNALLRMADSYASRLRYLEAALLYEKAANAGGGFELRALAGLARAAGALGHWTEARNACRRALEIDPGAEWAALELASLDVRERETRRRAERDLPASPDRVARIANRLRDAYEETGNPIASASERKDRVTRSLSGLEADMRSAERRLNELAKEINDERDYDRASLFNAGAQALAPFESLLYELEIANGRAFDALTDAQNALETALARIEEDGAPESALPFLAGFARQTRNAALSSDSEGERTERLSGDLLQAFENVQNGFSELDRYDVQYEMPSLVRSRVSQAFDRGLAFFGSALNEAADGQKRLRDGRTALDAAELNLNAALLTPAEADAFQSLFKRRFKPEENDFKAMLNGGYGFGDLALAAALSSERGSFMRDAAEGHRPETEPLFDFVERNYGIPDGADILLHFARNDLDGLLPRLDLVSFELSGPGDMTVRGEMLEADGEIARASAALENGDPEAARQLLEGRLDSGPGPQLARRLYAAALFETGRVKEAVDHIKTLLERNEGDPFAHLLWGRVHLEDGDCERASSEFEKTAGLAPGMAAPHSNLGFIRLLEGNAADAEAHFQAAVERAPGDAAVWSNLGFYHYRQGRRSRALDAWRKALELDPERRELSQIARRLESALAGGRTTGRPKQETE